MIEINMWINQFLQSIKEAFGERIWFVGLQGSYARGEANEDSDIDLVVILDELSSSDVHIYDKTLNTLPHRELICGFLSGKQELLNWETSELFQFYYDTTPIYGSLDELLSRIDENSIDRAIKIGACGIYHGCVHNMLHEKNMEVLRSLYKSASFVAQAICFKQTGKYIKRQKDLLKAVGEKEQAIIEIFIKFKKGEKVDFEQASETLFLWAGYWVRL